MGCCWRNVLLSIGAAASAGPVKAQQARELGLQGTLTASDPVLGVVGPYGGIRTSRRTRISAAIGGGASDRDFAFRFEVLGHFLFSPDRLRGWGPYLAAGLAAVSGPRDQGYMLLTLGAESNPGGASGWAAEVGVGGGVRVAVGYRWRRFFSQSRK